MNRPHVVAQPKTYRQIKYGINAIANMLAPTLGPISGPVGNMLDRGRVELLDDSATAVRRIITLGTPQRDVGAMMMRSLVYRVGQRMGDGGAIAAVLAREIFNEGMRMTTAGINAMQLVQGVRLGVEVAVNELRKQARPVTDENQLAGLALGVTRRQELSAVLGEMCYLLGPNARIITDKLVAPYLERRYIAGAHYGAEIASMYFYGEATRRRTILTNPVIAVVDERLTESEQAIALLEAALKLEAKSIAIIANDVSGGALNVLASNNQLPKEKKKLDIYAGKLKAIGDERRWALADLCLMTGGHMIGETGAHRAAKATADDLGRAQRFDAIENGIVIVANEGERAAIRSAISGIQHELAEMTPADDLHPKLIRRLSTLTGGVGELKIGAYSQTERDQLAALTERAQRVLTAAQLGGMVSGGGASLHHCACAVRKIEAEGDVAAGVELFAKALSAPLRQIMVNAHVDAPAVYLNRLSEQGTPWTYDAVNNRVVDAFASGVLDAADIMIGILQIASSGATMALTTDAIVYHKKPKENLEP